MSINEADATMTIRNRRIAAIGFLIALSAIALWAVPLLLTHTEVANINKWLPLMMAAGVVIAGIWSCVDAKQLKVNRESLFIATAIVAVGMWLGAHFALTIGGSSWTSYSFQKTGYGLIARVVSFVTYVMLLQMISSGRIVHRSRWLLAVVLLMVSILTPWIWAGAKVSVDYFHQ